jgi:hypothetical protein
MKLGFIGPCEKKWTEKSEAKKSQGNLLAFDILSNRNDASDTNLILLRRRAQENDNLKARLQQLLKYLKTDSGYNA